MITEPIHKRRRKTSSQIKIIYLLLTILAISLVFILLFPKRKIERLSKGENAGLNNVHLQLSDEEKIDTLIISFARSFGIPPKKIIVSRKPKKEDEPKQTVIYLPYVFSLALSNSEIQKKTAMLGLEIIDAVEISSRELEIKVGANKKPIRNLKLIRETKTEPLVFNIVTIIGGFGLEDTSLFREFLAFPHNITYGIIPGAPKTEHCYKLLRECKKRIILCIPIETEKFKEKVYKTFAIYEDLPEKEIRRRLANATSLFSDFDGIINFPFIEISNRKVVRVLLDELSKNQLSLVTKGDLKEEGFNSSKARIYKAVDISSCDNQKTSSISSKILRTVLDNRGKGPLVIYLNATRESLDALKETLPILTSWNVKVVSLGEI